MDKISGSENKYVGYKHVACTPYQGGIQVCIVAVNMHQGFPALYEKNSTALESSVNPNHHKFYAKMEQR